MLLLLPLNKSSSNLLPDRPIFSIIDKNQYQYFVINLTLIQKLTNTTFPETTNVFITMVETNGDCILLTSLSEKFPNYNQIFDS